VSLDIKGVEALAVLKARLDNVAAIIDRVMTTIDNHPEILAELAGGLGPAPGGLGQRAGEALEGAGERAGPAVQSAGGEAGRAAGEAGRGAAGAGGAAGDNGLGRVAGALVAVQVPAGSRPLVLRQIRPAADGGSAPG